MNEVIKAIKSRRSVRKYKSGALNRETLEAIVEAGYYAPTGHNSQQWHFSVIQDAKLIEEANAKTKKKMCEMPVDWIQKSGQSPAPVTYNAPVLIIVSSGKGAISGAIDCTAAMENMMIAAQSLGVGSCWMGFMRFIFEDDEMMRKLGVPEGYEPQQAAVFGYPAGESSAPERSKDVVTYTGTF